MRKFWDNSASMATGLQLGLTAEAPVSAPGDPGKIYAMALSPDGRWLAAGGWLAGPGREEQTTIRLYDFASGRLRRERYDLQLATWAAGR